MSGGKESKRIYDLAVKTALRAGAYLMDRYRANDRVIRESPRHDIKLDVDSETESLIVGMIRREFPDHGFVCEESGERPASADSTWIVDPLDGTVNFSKCIPHFCTSIAFRSGTRLVAGAVYDPVRRELFSGLREPDETAGRAVRAGAFLNDRPIGSRGVATLDEAVVSGGFFKPDSMDEGCRVFQLLAKRVLKVRFFGSAALDLCYLASGRVNGYIQHSVNEWDIAAAALIAELAGKRVEILSNRARGTLDVIAADAGIFDELKAAVAE